MPKNGERSAPSLQLSDLKSIRVFMAVAESSGLSAAQAKLGLSLSHISSILNNFEKRFGVKLCERGRSGFSLTEEGNYIYASSARLLQTLEKFESDLASFRGVLTGSLSIAAHPGDVTHREFILPKAINRFLSRENNRANIRLETASQEVIVNGIVNGTIDLAIGFFPNAHVGVVKYKLYEERSCLYCGAGHPLFARSDDPRTEEIVAHQFAMRSEIRAPYLPEVLSDVVVRAIASTQEARVLLILSGKFLTFVPDHVAARWVAAGRMRRLGGDQFSYTIEVEMITRDLKNPPALVTAFIQDYSAVCLEEAITVPRLWAGNH
ncbi:MAG TPA: LysR family transcriptional regulator [Stellaceae bacterium]|nr:LysR family transcriptional regulator [Stellaceae bacterium]